MMEAVDSSTDPDVMRMVTNDASTVLTDVPRWRTATAKLEQLEIDATASPRGLALDNAPPRWTGLTRGLAKVLESEPSRPGRHAPSIFYGWKR